MISKSKVEFDTSLPEGIYPDDAEASRRLVGTVIKHKGLAYNVLDCRRGSLHLSRLGDSSGEVTVVPRSDEGFENFCSFPVGFANVFSTGGSKLKAATYVTRVSARRVQQGLTSGNVVCDNPLSPTRFEYIYNTVGFREMIEGVYPTVEEILPLLHEDSAIAFDRRYALCKKNGFVFLLREGYDTDKHIAIITPNKMLLPSKNSYLMEELMSHPQLAGNIEIV